MTLTLTILVALIKFILLLTLLRPLTLVLNLGKALKANYTHQEQQSISASIAYKSYEKSEKERHSIMHSLQGAAANMLNKGKRSNHRARVMLGGDLSAG